jgi:hypothetical protein
MSATYTIDIKELKDLTESLLSLEETDSLLREISSTLLAEMSDRIHERGIKSDGTQIGTYSNSYLEYRIEQGKGSASNVTLFFTGQMQIDFDVAPIGENAYGLGYSNTLNFDKANWAEDRFGIIFQPTEQELQEIEDVAAEFITNTLK